MKTTLQQVADYAGVSRRTVDRVINNHPSVKPEVRERVQAALKTLNYQPNRIASALASSRKSLAIGILYHLEGYKNLDESVPRAIHDAEEELMAYSVQIFSSACTASEPEEYIGKIDDMVEKGIKALAICGPDTIELRNKMNELEDMGIPCVTFNSDIRDCKRRFFFGQDLYLSGRVAGNLMSKMLRKEDRLIVGCGYPSYYAHQLRVDGFTYELKKKNFNEEQWSIIHTDGSYGHTYELLKELYEDGWDYKGLYMSVEPNDAVGQFLEDYNLGDNVIVIGHDVTNYSAPFLKRGTIDFLIDQNIYRQAYRALTVLKDILRFKDTEVEQTNSSDLIIYDALTCRL